MSKTSKSMASRRDFLKTSGRVAALSALAGVAIPRVHAAEDNTIRVALIGCGGRGTGAASNALSVPDAPIKLVAMADVFDRRLTTACTNLKKRHADQVAVPEDCKFVGFDGYRKAMDCLRTGDVAILATPPAFRWVHFGYAIQKGLNVFMEKPVAVDGPTTRKMLKLGAEAAQKNLKVAVGLMVRHCRARQELRARIDKGELGDVTMLRAYRMAGHLPGIAGPRPEGISELMYQVQNFHSFLWASGGIFSDGYIHQIDECSWMKDAWPISAMGVGGRHYHNHGEGMDQNFDTYTVEYTYPDGAKLFYFGRSIPGCADQFASYAHGTKGVGVVSTSSHTPGKCRIFKGQNLTDENRLWAFPQPESNPYQLEWNDLVAAIRQNQPYNEVKRGAEASMVTAMGRLAAHTGQIVTFEEMLNHEQELAPGADKLTIDGPAPLLANSEGKYPVPQPGIITKREY